MSEVNTLFRAHMLLLKWAREDEAAEENGREAGTSSAAGDGSEERIDQSIPQTLFYVTSRDQSGS